jgi:TPR repeat protein
MYTSGEGVLQDDEQAFAWYHEAAKQGYAEAQNNLGVMYANGKGVAQDDRQAAFWFRKAAIQGEAMAQLNLGRMYFSGAGVRQDRAQAYLWTYLAAAQQSEKALNTLNGLPKAMTPSQIQEGKNLVREWVATHPQAAK